MKKLLFLLLSTVSFYSQTYQNPTFGKVTEKTNATDTTPAFFVTTQTDGVHKKTATALIAKVATVNDSLALKENASNKQNSLTVDGTGAKFPTVDAVNRLKWIKSNESLSLAQRKGGVLYGIIDQYTGEEMTLSKVTGTPTTDGVVYFQLGAEYFKRNFKTLNVKWFGATGDGLSDDTLGLQASLAHDGHIYIPSGNYKITNSLFLESNTTLEGNRDSKVFMESNPNGYNLICVKDKENVTIKGFSIVGVSGSGVAFPPAGVVDGQGVCFIAYGSNNISVIDMYSSANGLGSGNFYFSRVSNGRMENNYVELSSNAFVVDNYYNAPINAPNSNNSSNIIITGNNVRDMSGRGIAVDAGSASGHDNFIISNNTIMSCAWAGIQSNISGGIISSNTIYGKRDEGLSVMGDQQSLPTYYGLLIDLSAENLIIENNAFDYIMRNGLSILRGSNITIKNNNFSMAVSFENQWDEYNLELIADYEGAESFSFIQAQLDSNSPVSFENLTISGNIFKSELIHSNINKIPPGLGIYSNTINTSLTDKINIVIDNNDFTDINELSKVVDYFSANHVKSGNISLRSNVVRPNNPLTYGFVLANLERIVLENNQMTNLKIGLSTNLVSYLNMDGNKWKDVDIAVKFDVANLSNMISTFITSDFFENIGTWCFFSTIQGGYINPYSNASNCTYSNTSLNKIKNQPFPLYIKNLTSVAIPTNGYWAKGDIIDILNATNYEHFLCVADGNVGTWIQASPTENVIETKSSLNSPSFTGTPTAPTATAGTNNTQIATTAYVLGNSARPLDLTANRIPKADSTGDGLENSIMVQVGGNLGIGSATTPGEMLHLGDGNMLLEGGGEVAQKFKRDFTTTGENLGVPTGSGASVNPIFQIGRIIQAGDGDPEIRVMYSDDNTIERTVFEVDRKGIAASVKTGVGSHFEGFAGLTHVNPVFRLNSYPRMRLEMGAGANNITDVAVERSAAGGLDFYTDSANRGGFNSNGKLIINNTVQASPATNVNELATLGQVETNASSGIYTPTLTSVANISSLILTNASYTKTGNVFTVTVGYNCTATTANVLTIFSITLPVNRTSGGIINIGSGASIGNSNFNLIPVMLQGNSVSTVKCHFKPATTENQVGSVSFQYSILD